MFQRTSTSMKMSASEEIFFNARDRSLSSSFMSWCMSISALPACSKKRYRIMQQAVNIFQYSAWRVTLKMSNICILQDKRFSRIVGILRSCLKQTKWPEKERDIWVDGRSCRKVKQMIIYIVLFVIADVLKLVQAVYSNLSNIMCTYRTPCVYGSPVLTRKQ